LKRFLSALLAALFVASVLTACASANQIVSGSVVNLGQIGEISSINSDVAGSLGGERNAQDLANLTTAKFFELDATGRLQANPKLGAVEVLSKSPLTVKYTVADGATWSDGTPIDSSDLLLSWVAASGKENFYSMRDGSGLMFAQPVGTSKVGDRSLTLRFSQPVADFETAITLSVAAHVVGRIGASTLSVEQAKQRILDAIQKNDTAELALLAEAYRSGFNTWQGISDEKLFVSSGPYRVVKCEGVSGLQLKANAGFNLGAAPVIETVNLSYFADATTAVAALSDGSIDATTTQDSGLVTLSDLINLTTAISDPRANISVKASSSAEQVIFNFRDTGRFSTVYQGGDEARALKLRKAFMNIIPRARIVAGLSDAYKVELADSLVFQSGSPYYQSSIRDNGLSEYLFQDVEKASEMVTETGVELPMKVRVAFDINSPRAQAEWILLRERAASAGFKLRAVGGEDLGETLRTGSFDVFIGPQPLISLEGQNVFALTASSFVGFESTKVDSLLADLAKAEDERGRASALKAIDAELVAEAYGMPLYEIAALVVYSDRFASFTPSPRSESVTWGYQNWKLQPNK
jgi:peptide/nickel transport system substrate-binding protein